MTQDAWRHHDPSAGRRCAGKLVSGRPVSELTSVREGGGEDDGEDVWTDNDTGMTGSVVDAGWCWLERRVSDLGWGWGFGLRCALWRIDDNLWFINIVVRFCGIAAVGHST